MSRERSVWAVLAAATVALVAARARAYPVHPTPGSCIGAVMQDVGQVTEAMRRARAGETATAGRMLDEATESDRCLADAEHGGSSWVAIAAGGGEYSVRLPRTSDSYTFADIHVAASFQYDIGPHWGVVAALPFDVVPGDRNTSFRVSAELMAHGSIYGLFGRVGLSATSLLNDLELGDAPSSCGAGSPPGCIPGTTTTPAIQEAGVTVGFVFEAGYELWVGRGSALALLLALHIVDLSGSEAGFYGGALEWRPRTGLPSAPAPGSGPM